MTDDLLRSNLATSDPRHNLTGHETIESKLDGIGRQLTEILRRMDCADERVFNRPRDLRIPWGEWFVVNGSVDQIIKTGEGKIVAKIPNGDEYPDLIELLSRAKLMYEVLAELVSLFRKGGTRKANEMTALFVINDKPVAPTEVVTFYHMLVALAGEADEIQRTHT